MKASTMTVKAKSRARQFAELDGIPAKDFDPEADQGDSVEGSDEDESEVERAGTEHYVAVGKSKLRQKEPISLGPQYRGTRISREALEGESEGETEEEDDLAGDSEDEEFDDPETADLEADQERVQEDVEIDSDEAFGESDEERFKTFALRGSSQPNVPNGRRKRPTAADFMPDSEDEDMSGAEDEDDEDDHEEESDSSEIGGGARLNGTYDERSSESASDMDVDSDQETDGAEDAEDQDIDSSEDDNNGPKPKLSAMKKESDERKKIAATISDSARQNAEKGQAVRQQRKIFDGLLNIRIRLQKALIAANSFQTVDDDADVGPEAYDGAEEAAIHLWSMIDDLRSEIKGSTKGQKRKRDVDVSTPTDVIWSHMQADEEAARTKRQKTLNMWSTRIGTSDISRNKLNLNAKSSLTSFLEDQLSQDADRFIQRTHIPRSCAPAQVAKKIKEDTSIYDDADFYQALLKELVDQRSSDSNTAPSAGVARLQWAAMKEAKTTKVVDRKASRGRKMRFTVHEKLVGFMAPEDRRTWEQAAIDRFFGTLFGQKMELDENDESEEDINAEEAGLKLFRS